MQNTKQYRYYVKNISLTHHLIENIFYSPIIHNLLLSFAICIIVIVIDDLRTNNNIFAQHLRKNISTHQVIAHQVISFNDLNVIVVNNAFTCQQ